MVPYLGKNDVKYRTYEDTQHNTRLSSSLPGIEISNALVRNAFPGRVVNSTLVGSSRKKIVRHGVSPRTDIYPWNILRVSFDYLP